MDTPTHIRPLLATLSGQALPQPPANQNQLVQLQAARVRTCAHAHLASSTPPTPQHTRTANPLPPTHPHMTHLPPTPIGPHRYRGFKGAITEVPGKGVARAYSCSGTFAVTGPSTVEVLELPVRKWTQVRWAAVGGGGGGGGRAAWLLLQGYRRGRPRVHLPGGQTAYAFTADMMVSSPPVS